MTIHIGLIGGGNISATHARAARAIPGIEIAAIYGTNAGKIAALGQEQSAKPYQDFDAFLAHRPMDMVAIGSPSGLHAAQGIAAAQRGLHVLTEKPIDISTERADALIAAAERSGVKLGVMFQDRMKPGIRELREWIRTGVIGKPLLVGCPREMVPASGILQRLALARDDGRWTAAARLSTRQCIPSICCCGCWGMWFECRRARQHYFTRLRAKILRLQFSNLPTARLGALEATTAAYPGYPRRVEINGNRGYRDSRTRSNPDAANLRNLHLAQTRASRRTKTRAPLRQWSVMFAGIRPCLRILFRQSSQDTAPICDGHEGRRSIALVEAIYRAARNGMAVALEKP